MTTPTPADLRAAAAIERMEDHAFGGKAYSVSINGVIIGRIYQHFPTFERKPRGSRIVTKRWRSKTPRWKYETQNGRDCRAFYETRAAALDALADEMEGK